MRNFALTSTSLTQGHPDKLCDCISDAIIDSYLTLDENARITAECAIASGIVFLAVHVTSNARADLTTIVKETVREAGYNDLEFNPDTVTVLSSISQAAVEGSAIDSTTAKTANVNATVFGYACRHCPEMLPLSIVAAHRLVRRMQDSRRSGAIPELHPDGQAQVAIRYCERRPIAIEGITVIGSTKKDAANFSFGAAIREHVIRPVLDELDPKLSNDAFLAVNPFDTLVPGGPVRHAGLTGRKNDVDTYGGYSRHGGSALSGKDPSRVDRIGAYAARYAAKNIVAAGLAEECEVQICYGMGQRDPLSAEIDTFGSGEVPDEVISKALARTIDLNAEAIIERFALWERPRVNNGRYFVELGALGHFGRQELDLPWEVTDLTTELSRAV